jgi:hypothetical protein
LTSTDSASTERAPPGPASRATVTSRCRKRTARSRTLNPSEIAIRAANAREFGIRHAPAGRQDVSPQILEQRDDEPVGEVWRKIHALVFDLLLTVLILVADHDVTSRSVDHHVEGPLKGRAFLNEVIADQLKMPAL